MIEIAFDGVPSNEDIEELLKTSVRTVLRHLNIDREASVSLLISGDETLKRLNRVHHGEDKTTDVLSFANAGPGPEDAAPHLGDIAISIERAEVQAANGAHSLEAELQLLTVHGALHLLGYDHANLDEQREMWAVQNEILDQLGVELDREQIGS